MLKKKPALCAIDTQSSKPHGGKDAKYCVCVSADEMTKRIISQIRKPPKEIHKSVMRHQT